MKVAPKRTIEIGIKTFGVWEWICDLRNEERIDLVTYLSSAKKIKKIGIPPYKTNLIDRNSLSKTKIRRPRMSVLWDRSKLSRTSFERKAAES